MHLYDAPRTILSGWFEDKEEAVVFLKKRGRKNWWKNAISPTVKQSRFINSTEEPRWRILSYDAGRYRRRTPIAVLP